MTAFVFWISYRFAGLPFRERLASHLWAYGIATVLLRTGIVTTIASTWMALGFVFIPDGSVESLVGEFIEAKWSTVGESKVSYAFSDLAATSVICGFDSVAAFAGDFNIWAVATFDTRLVSFLAILSHVDVLHCSGYDTGAAAGTDWILW